MPIIGQKRQILTKSARAKSFNPKSGVKSLDLDLHKAINDAQTNQPVAIYLQLCFDLKSDKEVYLKFWRDFPFQNIFLMESCYGKGMKSETHWFVIPSRLRIMRRSIKSIE